MIIRWARTAGEPIEPWHLGEHPYRLLAGADAVVGPEAQNDHIGVLGYQGVGVRRRRALGCGEGVGQPERPHDPTGRSTSPWTANRSTPPSRGPTKTSNRAGLDARRRRHPDADDVIMVNERRELTETTIANLAVRLNGRWWTPPISAGCLPGVGREHLLATSHLHERSLYTDDLRRAEKLAVVSSIRGWRPAALIT